MKAVWEKPNVINSERHEAILHIKLRHQLQFIFYYFGKGIEKSLNVLFLYKVLSLKYIEFRKN